MSRQLELVPAEQARDEAIAQVARPAEEWIRGAVQAVRAICARRGYGAKFTTDAVWALLDHWGVGPPEEPRALGAAMMRAKRIGLCEPTAVTQKSVRVDCHARPIRVWKIL
jgi:hypothetical protein